MNQEFNENKSKITVKNKADVFIGMKREAYSSLDQALKSDSNSNLTSQSKKADIDYTIILYEKSLTLIENAINYYELNKNQLSSSEDTVKLNTQLKRMKDQTEDRLSALKFLRMNENNQFNDQNEYVDLSDDILPDDYFSDDEVPNNQIGSTTSSILTNKNQNNLINNEFSKANHLLNIENGAQIFYIADDGTVSTPSYPTTLNIYSFDESKINDAQNNKKVAAFIQIGSWMYPLVPNQSPAMKTNFNAYIFPNNDETNQMKASFIGITFSQNISTEQVHFFEDVLTNYGSLIHQDKPSQLTNNGLKYSQTFNSNIQASSVQAPFTLPTSRSVNDLTNKPSSISNKEKENKIKDQQKEDSPQTTADYVAKQLIGGAQYLSQGVGTTSEYASKYLQIGSDKLKSQLKPNEQPANIDPKVQGLLKNVRYGTHVSVRVSSFLLNKLGDIATSTAKFVAPHIKSGSKTLMTKTGIVSKDETANNYVENAFTVAGGGVQGFAIVYDSLEEAAKKLAKSFSDHTVNVVDYKYGPDAAKAAENTLYSAVNIGMTVNNVQGMKITRTLAKTAKQTAKEVIIPSDKKNLNDNVSK